MLFYRCCCLFHAREARNTSGFGEGEFGGGREEGGEGEERAHSF